MPASLYDEEKKFFKQLIENSVCKCHVSNKLFHRTFKPIGNALRYMIDTGDLHRVVSCPTAEHVVQIFNIANFEVSAIVTCRTEWLNNTLDQNIEKATATLKLTTRQFDHETS